jgi:lysophospholipase L1-like esterase
VRREPAFSRRAGTLVLAVVATVGSLACAELAYRLRLERRYRRLTAAWRLLPASPLAYRLRANYEGRAQLVLDREKSVPYRTNADGFRGRLPGAKRPATARVLVLGDSYTFGWAVTEEEVYPQRLEAILRQAGADVEVLNLGVPGYNTEQERHLLEETLPRYDPDIVVLGYVLNDAEPTTPLPPGPGVIHAGAVSWLWKDGREVLRRRLGDAGRPPETARRQTSDYLEAFAAESPGWRRSKAALADIAAACRRHRLALVLMIFPDFTLPFDASYPYATIHETVAGWGRELEARTVDLWPVFRGEDHRAYMVPGDGHPNAAAHARVARALGDALVPLVGAADGGALDRSFRTGASPGR